MGTQNSPSGKAFEVDINCVGIITFAEIRATLVNISDFHPNGFLRDTAFAVRDLHRHVVDIVAAAISRVLKIRSVPERQMTRVCVDMEQTAIGAVHD